MNRERKPKVARRRDSPEGFKDCMHAACVCVCVGGPRTLRCVLYIYVYMVSVLFLFVSSFGCVSVLTSE